jgi:hypothetical protein
MRCRTSSTASGWCSSGAVGHLVYTGDPDDARRHFGVERFEEIYERLAGEEAPVEWARRFEAERALEPPAAAPGPAPQRRQTAGFARQWGVLTRRTFETLARNRLTMAILLGSPAMVVAMFVVLFRPGAFDAARPDPSAITMILFWVTFGAFFFGLTYGLLQICTEQAIVRRESFVGQRLSAYLLSKVTVLLPFLLVVVVLMLGVLRALDRLPADGAGTYVAVGVSLSLDAAAALTLGLLASAAVAHARRRPRSCCRCCASRPCCSPARSCR